MTKSNLHRLLIDAQECADLETYMLEFGGSLPAEYYPTGAVQLLTDLWNLSHNLTFRAIRRFSGLTQREFSAEYGIPTRTVEDWDTGKREPPRYVLELLLSDIITAQTERYAADPKPYYLPTSAYWDTAFADSDPVCVDRKEAERLYSDWYGEYGANYDGTTEFDDLWREADADEIAEYGTYDS